MNLKTVKVVDPITKIGKERSFAVFKGGQDITYQTVVSNAYSASSWNFSAPPPDENVYIDRQVKVSVPVTVTFSGSDQGHKLIQINKDAFRAHPISNIVETCTVKINGIASTIALRDVIEPLSRFNTPYELVERSYSTVPCAQDNYQNYSDGDNGNNNPLRGYWDGIYEYGRGAFPMTVTQSTNTSSVVTATLTEIIYLSPLTFGHKNKGGFRGVKTMEVIFTLSSDLNRIWSHSSSGYTINTPVVTFGQPQLEFKYITPDALDPPRDIYVYPYHIVTPYLTGNLSVVNSNATLSITSQAVKLMTIPRRLYIYVKRQKSDETHLTTNTYFAIESVNITWKNKTGLLASASKRQLYEISVENGCNMNWTQWSGGPIATGGDTITYYGTVGSILCLEVGKDIPLDVDEAAGMNGEFNFQVNVLCKNVNQTVNITPELTIIAIASGTFTITRGTAMQEIGLLSKKDVLEAKEDSSIDYESIREVYGGDFWSGLKDLGSKLFSGIRKGIQTFAPVVKDIMPVAQKYAPQILKSIGLGKKDVFVGSDGAIYHKKTGEKIISRGGELVGGAKALGFSGGDGGIMVGGKKVSKSKLKKSLLEGL